MDKAAAALDNELRQSWHLARSNPDAWKARKLGADALRSKFEALLTDTDAWV